MSTQDSQGTLAAFDIEAVRAQFPALERGEAGHPVAYFDGPGGTQVPRRVVEAMNDYLYHHNANTHWNFPTSAETDDALLAAREAFADFLGCIPEEVVFGANMTTLTMHVARALGAGWGEGDEIVVTELDHQANIAPWRRLEAERGVTVRVAPLLPETGTLDLDALDALIGARTRLVAVGAASNALGTVTDVAPITAAARAAGALTFVDAVHLAPHERIDVAAMGCDLLACSAYKFHGPHVGVLFGRRALLEELDVPRLPPASNAAPERIETGTLNHEGIVGAAEAVEFLASIGTGTDRPARLASAFDALHRREGELVARLWNGLADVPGVRLFGPAPDAPRTPTVGFTLEGVPSDRVAARLAEERGVFVSDGDFYATTVVSALGLPPDGLVRAGCACTTTEEEVDRLVEGVRAIAGS
ncbi:MAG: cysteine desulfurase-like protein [Planctomycetota bacterium]|jgi:cysteine desulfurase family protein (TIGR01976 family)